jgi:hypothetical protein
VDFEPAISQKEVWYAFEYEEDVRRTRDSDGRCAEDGVTIGYTFRRSRFRPRLVSISERWRLEGLGF